MQSLEIISVNLWQILISLCNLLILFFILKKFLFKPVKKTAEQRQNAIDEQYARAAEAEAQANRLKELYEEKMSGAEHEAQQITDKAMQTAAHRRDDIIDDARAEAGKIIKRAEDDAVLERQKAESEIKREIVDVSTALTEKMIGREISASDHDRLIDEFIGNIGDDDE